MGTSFEIELESRIKEKSLVLFDGVCNLCNSRVDFIVRKDKHHHFIFASLQSEAGKHFLKKFNKSTEDFDSMVLIKGDKFFQKSRAVLEICKRLRGGWPLLYGFVIVPFFIRDLFYDLVAKNRYKWYGKRETCRIPTPEERERFVG